MYSRYHKHALYLYSSRLALQQWQQWTSFGWYDDDGDDEGRKVYIRVYIFYTTTVANKHTARLMLSGYRYL
jgi:hypothetical protein